MPTLFRDLRAEKQREQTEDMLRVHREMNEKAVSAFEKVIRLLLAANTGGVLLISGLVSTLHDTAHGGGLLVVAGALFLVGLGCAGTPTILLLRRFQKLSARMSVDIELVHTNNLSIEDAHARLTAGTHHPRFANAIHCLVAGAIALFILGALVALVAVASL